MTTCIPLRVRYAETDQMGVVYYANYFIWFELGRTEFLRQLGYNYKDMEAQDGCYIPVVEATCRYKAPARYDEELVVETRLLHLRTSVLKFGYQLFRPEPGGGRKLLAEGETVHVLVNRDMRKAPMPEKYAIALRNQLKSSPAE